MSREGESRLAWFRHVVRTTADAQALPFFRRSFDTVRLLPRAYAIPPAGGRALGEICRVARRRVILDVPRECEPGRPGASFSPRAMERLGLRDVQAYRTFPPFGNLPKNSAQEGFRVLEVHRELSVPLAVTS